MKKKWIIISLVFVIVLSLSLFYFFKLANPELIGYSKDGNWKATYEKQEKYWELHLTPLHKHLGTPKNLIFKKGDEIEKYPGNAAKNEEPNDPRLYYYCSTLGEKPDPSVSNSFQFETEKGEKVIIPLTKK